MYIVLAAHIDEDYHLNLENKPNIENCLIS
jgi:hypothetical protein